jgi:signal transduction histidine kinase
LKKSILFLILILSISTLSAQDNVIDSLQKIVALQRHDTTEINVMLMLAYEFIRKDLNKVNAYSHEVIRLARIKKAIAQEGSGYFYLVTSHQNSGNLDSALYYLDLLGAHSKANPTYKKMEANYNQAAGLYYKNIGQPKKALTYMIKNIALVNPESENQAGLLLNIGNIYYSLSDYNKAMSYHLQSLRLFEKLGSQRGQSFCLQSLGNEFLGLKQYEKAKGYFERSLKIKEDMKDNRGIISTSTSLGDVYKEFKQYTLSEKYYKQALHLAEEMKIISEEARCHFQLSLLYKHMGDNQKAYTETSTALKLARQSGDSTMSAKISGNLMALKFEEQKEKGIETTLISNLNTIVNSGDRSGEALEYSRLSDYYASRNQFDKAFFYLQKHEALKDSIEGSEVLIQLKNLEEQYQSDKKQREIELLKKDQELQALALSRERTNVILIAFALISVVLISILLVNRYRIMNRANRELELEKVRNHIARDLHDDIGSTLSSINIMSQLAMNGDTKDNLSKIALHSSQMMENMSDIVWSINPKNDTLEQVVLKMKEFAFEILEPKEITHTFQIDNNLAQLKLDVAKRKNLFLIFKEAINNAAKYSEGSSVSISLSVTHHKIQLSIKDNGKGFEEELVKRGNGLINMKERAASMGGKLSQHSTPGNGTEIHLEIPIT